MGGKTSKEKKVEATPDIQSPADLALNGREDIQLWQETVNNLLDTKVADAKKKMIEYQESMIADPNKLLPIPTDPTTITRIDDGVRILTVKHSLAPKDANEIKRLIRSTEKLDRIIMKAHFGGPGVGFRDQIASRVLLAVGKWFGESLSCTSFDMSRNDIGGSTRGIDMRTHDVLNPVDVRKVGPSGGYLLQGLAESKTKRGVANPEATNPEERITLPMDRVVLKGNNLTHYGWHWRPIGLHLRSLLSNVGRIISLDLSHCSLGPDAVTKGLSHGIRGIARLNLRNNLLGGRWHQDGSFVPDTLFAREMMKCLLDENCSLKSLDLSSNRLSEIHAKYLSKGLFGNKTLKNIHLGFNAGFQDDGVCMLLQSQCSNKGVAVGEGRERERERGRRKNHCQH